MHSELTIVVIAKECRPGRVKTRLSPPLSFEQAAQVASASLRDTLSLVRRLPARRRVLAFAGTPPAAAAGFDVVQQPAGGLDRRLAAAFAACVGPTLLIGMDTPQLTYELLAPAVDSSWGVTDAWFGPALDGGFWALGLAAPDPQLVMDVPMSRPDTGERQLARLAEAGLRVDMLPALRDVDLVDDAVAVAKTAPTTEFARAMKAATDQVSA